MLYQTIHPSWKEFLTDDRLKQIDSIEKQLGDNISPSPSCLSLRIFNLDLDKIKIICVGMDPYPEKGRATGRAFEVNGLKDWNESFRQVSLKNIIRGIYIAYHPVDKYEAIPKFNDLKKEISSGAFKVKPPNQIFNYWETQGFVSLNVYPTCETGKTGSHKFIWLPFSIDLIHFISEKRPDLIWFLWGNDAKGIKDWIKHGNIYESRHPMMCSEKYDDDFLKNNCFKDTKTIINWI